MIRSFNASTTVHPFSLPRMNRIAADTPAPQVSPASPTPKPSPMAGTTSAGASSPQVTQSGSPNQAQRTINSSPSPTGPPDDSTTTRISSEGTTQDGINFATAIAPFSPVGAPPASTIAPSSAASSTAASAASSDSSPLSQPGIISISVVGGVVGIIAVSLLFFALRRRRRQLVQHLQLDSGPTSPPSRHTSYSGHQPIPPAYSSARSQRSVPSPLPIFSSSYHDEKEVFTPGQPSAAALLQTPSTASIYSPRRPTHPLISPSSPLPLAPLSATANPASYSTTPVRRSRSWNFDVTPPPRSPGLPPPSISSLPPLPLSASTPVPEIRPSPLPHISTQASTQSQNGPVSPMYPLSPLPPAVATSLRAGTASPISPLAGRSELPSPGPGAGFTFADVRWGGGSARGSARGSANVSRRVSARQNRSPSRIDEEAVEIGATASVLGAPATAKELPEPVIEEAELPANSAETETVPEVESLSPIELPADRHSHAATSSNAPVEMDAQNDIPPMPPSTGAADSANAGMSGVGMTPMTSRPVVKRSETAKSGASSRYSGASGGSMGDRVIPKAALARSSTSATTTATNRTRSWETDPETDTFSIGSILQLLRGNEQGGTPERRRREDRRGEQI